MAESTAPPTPTETTSTGPDQNTLYSGRVQTRIALIAFAATFVGSVITGFVTYAVATKGNNPESLDSPRLSNLEFEWVGNEGRYLLTGEADNLAPGQLIWAYNQPLDDDTNNDGIGDGAPGRIYPEYGPCTVDRQTFTCDLGWAGRAEEDVGKPFAIWAAIVTEEDAHEAASLKANFVPRPAFINFNAVPHVDGEDTMVKTDETRPPL